MGADRPARSKFGGQNPRARGQAPFIASLPSAPTTLAALASHPSITPQHRSIATPSAAGVAQANPLATQPDRSECRLSWLVITAPTHRPMVAPITAAPLQWPHPPHPPAHPASSHAFLTSTPHTSPQTELPQLHSRCTAAAPLAAHRIFSSRPRHSLSGSSAPPSSSPRWRFVRPLTPTGIDPADPDPQRSRLRAPLPRSGRVTKTASLTLAATMASRPALPPSRSVWLGGGVRSASRRSSSAATRRQRTGGRRSASPPLTHCEVSQRRQTAGGAGPHHHRTRGVVGGPTRALLLVASSRAAAHGGAPQAPLPLPVPRPPPSSPSSCAPRGHCG